MKSHDKRRMEGRERTRLGCLNHLLFTEYERVILVAHPQIHFLQATAEIMRSIFLDGKEYKFKDHL